MLSAIAIVPSAPVMVPQLASSASGELTDLREAVFAAAASLPPKWVAVGVGPADDVVGPGRAGTFAGYGVDLPVALSPGADDRGRLPLCALMTGWLRGAVNPDARVEVRVLDDQLEPDAAVERGRALRAEIEQTGEAVGLLVVADGFCTLTPQAPGGYHPDTVAMQAALDDALAAGDTVALMELPRGIVGRAAYQALAGFGAPRSAEERYRGAPYGVGYFAGVWQP